MGCASSKPSSSSSSKTKKKDPSSNANNKANNAGKTKPNDVKKSDANNKVKTSGNELDELIKIDKKLLSQIDQYRDDVVNYIVNLVRRDLNAELVSNGNQSKGNIALLASAALSAPDNDSLITEASSKAISLIKGGKCDTYRSLADSLKSSQFLCKTQTHKPRICDLTADTIRRCLNDIYSHANAPDFNLLTYLNSVNGDLKQLTPPATPQKVDSQKTSSAVDPSKESNDLILLSRAEANKVARILFLTNRARPVIHVSERKRGAYYVNIQQDDNSEVPATRQQIEEIISFSAANRHHEQPSIYEVAETFLNNSEAALKLSPLWPTSVSTPTHTRLEPSPPVSPVEIHIQNPQASSFETPETPVVASRRGDDHEQVQVSSTPMLTGQADETAATNEITSSINETSNNLTNGDVTNETIETDPAAGEESLNNEDDLRTQLGAAANLILLAKNLQQSANEDEATVPNGSAEEEPIIIDEPSNVNTSNILQIVEEVRESVIETENQVPSSPSETIQIDQNNNADVEQSSVKPEAEVDSQQLESAENSVSENLDELKKVEAAATTIQATFRGYKTRKQFKPTKSASSDPTTSDNNSLAENSINNTADLADETTAVDSNEQQDVENTASNNLTSSNTKENNSGSSNENDDAQLEATTPTSDELNGELSQEQAVVKIQATYRGFRARKELKSNDQTNKPPQQAGAGGHENTNTNTNQTNNK